MPTGSVFFEHLPRLVAVSRTFCTYLEGDASIWGVSAAFVTCSQQLESVLVHWCSVVGNVIASPGLSSPTSSSSLSRPRLSGSNTPTTVTPTRSGSLHSIFGGGASSSRGQASVRQGSLTMSPARAHTSQSSSSSSSSSSSGTTLVGAMSDDGHGSSPPSLTKSMSQISRSGFSYPWRRTSAPLPTPLGTPTPTDASTHSLPSTKVPEQVTQSSADKDSSRNHKSRRLSKLSPSAVPPLPPKSLTLQDIAIMPTQRVARYVMLYQDLAKMTPPASRSYPVVKEALTSALRIAQLCNAAQNNNGSLVSGRSA